MTEQASGEQRRANTGVPRWVKVIAVLAVLGILAFVALHLTGNGLGGPGSHVLP